MKCHPERSEGPGREVARRSSIAPPLTQVPRYARDDRSIHLILYASFFLLLLFLLGCAQKDDGRTHIEFWALGREGEEVVKLVRDFEKLNPTIAVDVQQMPWTAAHEKLLTAIVGESTPDVAQIGNSWIPEFQAVNAIADLRPFVRSLDQADYFPGIWRTNEVDGVLYGIPWYVDTRVLFFRRDLL